MNSGNKEQEFEDLMELSELDIELGVGLTLRDSSSSTSSSTTSEKRRRDSGTSLHSNELKQDLDRAKTGVHFVDGSAGLDMKHQKDIPTEVDKSKSHQSLMEKTVECGIPSSTGSKKLDSRSWLKNFDACITDPEVLTNLRKEREKGPKGFFFCLSFLQKALKKQRQVNKALDVRINNEKLLLLELRDKIQRCKAKLMEASKIETLAQTQADSKDELKLKEKLNSSLEDVRTPVIFESGDKIDYLLEPVDELSSPLMNVFGGIDFPRGIACFDTISEEECGGGASFDTTGEEECDNINLQ